MGESHQLHHPHLNDIDVRYSHFILFWIKQNLLKMEGQGVLLPFTAGCRHYNKIIWPLFVRHLYFFKLSFYPQVASNSDQFHHLFLIQLSIKRNLVLVYHIDHKMQSQINFRILLYSFFDVVVFFFLYFFHFVIPRFDQKCFFAQQNLAFLTQHQ